jgi:hypothetical protein
VIRPALTEATVGSELDHVTFAAGEPSLRLAVACTEVPDWMDFVETVITRDGGLGSFVDPPPQARATEQPASMPRIPMVVFMGPPAVVPTRLCCEAGGSTLY